MLELLIGTVVIGGAFKVVSSILSNTSEQHRRWENSRTKLEHEIHQQNERLRARQYQASNNLLFHQLNEQYYQSRCLANKAYSLLDEAHACRYSLEMSIRVVDKQIYRTESKIAWRKQRGWKTRNLEKRIEQFIEVKKQLYEKREILCEQINSYLQKVKELNRQTHALKEKIRDNCGDRGRIWFYKLEERKRNQKLINGT